MIFEGAISIKAILEEKKRLISWIMVDLNKDDRNTRYIVQLAEKMNIEIRRESRETIDQLAHGKTHGGLIMEAGTRISDPLSITKKDPIGTYFLIEGIEDPFNLGYAIRSLYAFGAKAIIIKQQHLIASESIIVKSSAGASEKLCMVIVENFEETIDLLKAEGYKLIISQRDELSTSYDAFDYCQKTMIALGGEKRGLSAELIKAHDEKIYIPYMNEFKNALNLTSALTTIASEVARQKRNYNKGKH